MLLERPMHPDVKSLLLSQAPLQIAHLIKFERPSRPESGSGLVSTSKQRYAYITDASRDVTFDDGSTDLSGNNNGPQNYVANKVLQVSGVQEDTEAKASAYSLVLDGNGIGAVVSDAVNIVQVSSSLWDITFSTSTHLLAYGFREGDKVLLSGATSGYVNIVKFRAYNTVRVALIDTPISAAAGYLTMALSSEEVISLLTDKNADDYASFINREVYIYRAYFENNSIVGTPVLLFKGIISGVGFDDTDTGLTVTWNLSSFWGDFSEVRGRITSDDFQRALDENGIPQPQSALKPIYAYDKGFAHAETSVHILAQYKTQQEEQDVKVKKGFLGIGSKVKVKKYYVTEINNTELDFNLQASAIPVIYGVRNTQGIPVFADTLNDDSSTVYVVYALSEGEIGGIYDVYIEGNSLICNDLTDFNTRSTQTADNTVQLVCRGRADRGDVLGGTSSVSNITIPYYTATGTTSFNQAATPYDLNYLYYYQQYVHPTVTNTDNTGAGVFDGQSISLTDPQNITLDVFGGKPGQKAASALVQQAQANNFKLQNDFWNTTNTGDYWGPNHRLLDTAYILGKFVIAEGETTVPGLEFIVRGKTINCYNYDKSYSHYNNASSENSANFNLGDYVNLTKPDGTVLVSNVQIVDKWTFRNRDGSQNVRFRFSSDPPLQYTAGVPGITKFMMVSGLNTWTMITYNYEELDGTNAVEWKAQINSVSNNNGYVQFNFTGNSGYTVGKDPQEESSVFSVVDQNGNALSVDFFGNAVLVGDISANSLVSKYGWGAAGVAAQSVVDQYIVRRNSITIPNGSSTDGYYDGYLVTLTHTDTTTGQQTVQTKEIIDYTSGIATIDGLWDYGFHPRVGDSVSLTPAYADSRISINPAMQLMDYITSVTYGKGLDINRDLNFESWLETARSCDEQSDVTVQTTGTTTTAAYGDIYRFPANGPLLWQGQVLGSDSGFIEFTNVLGKLTNAWNSWRSFTAGQIMYADSNVYQVLATGVQATKPTHTYGTVSNLQYISSLAIYKVTGSGPTTIGLMTNGNPVRAQKNGTIVPGYSLYDSDGIDYWRYVGWDEFSQRYVTRHQTNLIIDTSVSLLDNVNSFLEHFDGILRYTAGQYYLDLEEPADLISEDDSEARNITSDHIIGKIRISDDGIKNAYNSLTVGYADPANKFESRNISFFNSDYLKADRGVPKKGNLTVPGITNYYNTRLLADRTLNKSRFGMEVSFNMSQRGTLLLAGLVVQLQYPKYGWNDKQFRITQLTNQTNATVDIVATEYDDSFYGLSKISKQAALGLAGNNAAVTGVGSPTNLRATSADNNDETKSGVQITWENNPVANISKNAYTEIYSSYSSHLYVDIDSISGNTITTLENPHQLVVGEQITSLASVSGLEANKTYFILATPAANTLQVSETKGGPIVGLTDSSNVDSLMQTTNLISTVSVPGNSYVDVFGGIDGRVVKYYWARHKVIQEA